MAILSTQGFERRKNKCWNESCAWIHGEMEGDGRKLPMSHSLLLTKITMGGPRESPYRCHRPLQYLRNSHKVLGWLCKFSTFGVGVSWSNFQYPGRSSFGGSNFGRKHAQKVMTPVGICFFTVPWWYKMAL